MATRKSTSTKEKVPCRYCGRMLTPGGGLTNHEKSCGKNHEAEQGRQCYEDELRRRVQGTSSVSLFSGAFPHNTCTHMKKQWHLPPAPSERSSPPLIIIDLDDQLASDIPSAMNDPDLPTASPDLRRDDFYTRYHPASNRPPETVHFEDYGHSARAPRDPPPKEPWKPYFNT
ncbi:hypothetical protein OF83DRAFT_1179815 [Amylostereum chailletii]|nr:hypothetical protein OF83DRAFT_1179815 [Amylostereum chailletii]